MPRSLKKGAMPASPPSVDAVLLIANPVNGNCLSQSSLRPLAYARSVSPMTPLARSTLAFVFFWYAEPTMRLERHLARELGVVIRHEHVGTPGSIAETHVAEHSCLIRSSGRLPRGNRNSMRPTREKVHAILDHVECPRPGAGPPRAHPGISRPGFACAARARPVDDGQ